MDIMEEFAEWAKRKGYVVGDDEAEDTNFYDLWAEFLDEEYNDQRNWKLSGMDEDTGLNPAARKGQEFDSPSFRQL
jgi:hypothetical protein